MDLSYKGFPVKRVSLFCGHYGSGKTNIAVNYAKALKEAGLSVAIADMDVVNPYFRTKDSEGELLAAGIDVISLPFANTSVDLPALPGELYGLVQQRARHAVLDVGGDDRGAFALGRYAPYILEENDYQMFFVANFYRPLTRSAEEAFAIMKEIEAACKIPFTAIINNSNLGDETTPEDIEKTKDEAEALAKISGLPIAYVTASVATADKLNAERVLPLTLQEKKF